MSADSVGTFKTGNTTWNVHVSGHQFIAIAPGFSDVHGDSWDEMENKAKVAASKAKVKVAVPYVYLSWTGHEHRKAVLVTRVATGLHAASGNVLYKDGSGSGQETYGHSRSGFMTPFEGNEDKAEYLALVEQRHALDKKISEIEARYRFGAGGLKGAVEKAIEAEHARRAGETDGE
jgi:hypothetical protein